MPRAHSTPLTTTSCRHQSSMWYAAMVSMQQSLSGTQRLCRCCIDAVNASHTPPLCYQLPLQHLNGTTGGMQQLRRCSRLSLVCSDGAAAALTQSAQATWAPCPGLTAPPHNYQLPPPVQHVVCSDYVAAGAGTDAVSASQDSAAHQLLRRWGQRKAARAS